MFRNTGDGKVTLELESTNTEHGLILSGCVYTGRKLSYELETQIKLSINKLGWGKKFWKTSELAQNDGVNWKIPFSFELLQQDIGSVLDSKGFTWTIVVRLGIGMDADELMFHLPELP